MAAVDHPNLLTSPPSYDAATLTSRLVIASRLFDKRSSSPASSKGSRLPDRHAYPLAVHINLMLAWRIVEVSIGFSTMLS
jgi:hypothetical protein